MLTSARVAQADADTVDTQAVAAGILGIQQPHVSALMRNRAGSFSVGRLMDFLTALGHDVEINVKPAHRQHGLMSVLFT